MLQRTKIREQAVAGPRGPRSVACIPTSRYEKARRWAGPHRRLAQSAPELGSAASLVGVALCLNGPGGLIGSAHRQLRNALVGVDHLLQAVPHEVALNRHKVLHRAGADNPVHSLDVLLHTILHEAEHLLRDLLSAPDQNRAGLRHSLEVLG